MNSASFAVIPSFGTPPRLRSELALHSTRVSHDIGDPSTHTVRQAAITSVVPKSFDTILRPDSEVVETSVGVPVSCRRDIGTIDVVGVPITVIPLV